MKLHHVLFCALVALVALVSLVALGACARDKPRNDGDDTPNAQAAMSPAEYRKRQQAFADSVLRGAKSAGALVEQLGEGYAIGSSALHDTIAALARGSDCFQNGRRNDPYLAGAVSVFVNMTAAGADRVQVQEAKWTSKAGDMVNVCLGQAMKYWKLGRGTMLGRPAGYIVQVRFRSDSTEGTGTDPVEKDL